MILRNACTHTHTLFYAVALSSSWTSSSSSASCVDVSINWNYLLEQRASAGTCQPFFCSMNSFFVVVFIFLAFKLRGIKFSVLVYVCARYAERHGYRRTNIKQQIMYHVQRRIQPYKIVCSVALCSSIHRCCPRRSFVRTSCFIFSLLFFFVLSILVEFLRVHQIVVVFGFFFICFVFFSLVLPVLCYAHISSPTASQRSNLQKSLTNDFMKHTHALTHTICKRV